MSSVSCLVLILRYTNSLSDMLSCLRVLFVFITKSLIRALYCTAFRVSGKCFTGIPSKFINTYPYAPCWAIKWFNDSCTSPFSAAAYFQNHISFIFRFYNFHEFTINLPFFSKILNILF